MKHNNKPSLIAVCLACALLLTGYIGTRYVLKNATRPFIELNGAEGDSIGNALKAYEASNPTPKPTAIPTLMPTPTVTPKPTGMLTPSPSPADEVNITVGNRYSAQIIIIEGIPYMDLDSFKDKLKNGGYEGKRFILHDMYAETLTFKKVIEAVDELYPADMNSSIANIVIIEEQELR
ncbi:MAG: hypothetical protein K6G81_00085 [Lachnospiraceae bacterium]|nr:hypothetical protein [Lachnospiraceae bacterium]